MKLKTALSIAGSDCSAGAGIQADLKTMLANGVYGMSAVTALTAQNTTGVSAVCEVSPDFLKKQIDMIFVDIPPDAVKIGMVSSSELIKVIAERLTHYSAKNIVLDPVMVATSGASLIESDALSALKEHLFPIAKLITPNIPEAEILSQSEIKDKKSMLFAAEKIADAFGVCVLIKGGHSINDADDLLVNEKGVTHFHGKRIENHNTHGTGCTLSSAIAANLAKGFSLEESVTRAKNYISLALSSQLDLGNGSGPINHGFNISGFFTKENIQR